MKRVSKPSANILRCLHCQRVPRFPSEVLTMFFRISEKWKTEAKSLPNCLKNARECLNVSSSGFPTHIRHSNEWNSQQNGKWFDPNWNTMYGFKYIILSIGSSLLLNLPSWVAWYNILKASNTWFMMHRKLSGVRWGLFALVRHHSISLLTNDSIWDPEEPVNPKVRDLQPSAIKLSELFTSSQCFHYGKVIPRSNWFLVAVLLLSNHLPFDAKFQFFTEINCGYPGYITNGFIVGSSFGYLDTISYACRPGFALKGSSEKVCQSNEQWEPPGKPTCQGKMGIKWLINCSQQSTCYYDTTCLGNMNRETSS